MANQPSNANAIGNSMANIGAIQGQGQIAGAQAKQQGWQNAITGIGSAAGQYFGRPQAPAQPQGAAYGGVYSGANASPSGKPFTL